MLRNLDVAASDALQSFTNALAQAQQTLQHDQERFENTAQLLQQLRAENDVLRLSKVHNSQELQRLDALRAEKAKLTRQMDHKRTHIQSCAAHVQQLKQPRLQLTEEVEGVRREMKARRLQYCVHAAQIHSYVAQFLLPQNSLDNLRKQLALVEAQHRDNLTQVHLLEAKVAELENEVAALKADGQLRATQHTESDASAMVEGDRNTRNANLEPGRSCGAEEDQVTLSEAETLEQLTSKRAAQQAAYTAAQLKFAQEEADLQKQREELKRRVLQLCGAIEGADAAQQEEQKQYRDALDSVGSSGAMTTCKQCHCDMLAAFS